LVVGRLDRMEDMLEWYAHPSSNPRPDIATWSRARARILARLKDNKLPSWCKSKEPQSAESDKKDGNDWATPRETSVYDLLVTCAQCLRRVLWLLLMYLRFSLIYIWCRLGRVEPEPSAPQPRHWPGAEGQPLTPERAPPPPPGTL